MAKQSSRANNAKRASRPNPREERNIPQNPRFNLHSVVTMEPKRRKIDLLPRNLNQEHYIDLLEDDIRSVVFSTGPAGCGKTYIATLFALRELLLGNTKKIIITRPIVGSGDGVGYLPGGIIEKLSPWCRPVLDTLKEYLSVPELERYLAEEKIELLGFFQCRGLTTKNAIVIVDEAQNATKEELLMMLTRLGDNSRMIITGDLAQSDLRRDNGLKFVVDRIKNQPERYKYDSIGFLAFDRADVVRHPVIEDVLDLFD